PVAGPELDASYWAQNLRDPVLFAPTVEALAADRDAAFIEMSPHPILTEAILQTLEHAGARGIALPSLRREQPEREVMLESLGGLYTFGLRIDWSRVYPVAGPASALPSYPWQRQRYWVEPASPSARDAREPDGHPLLGRRLDLAVPSANEIWENDLA